jgi:hypothetical protein
MSPASRVDRVAVGDQPKDLGVEALLDRPHLHETRQPRPTRPGGAILACERIDIEHVFDATKPAPPVQGPIGPNWVLTFYPAMARS